MESRFSVGIFLCFLLFSTATSSPATKKGLETAERKIIPSISDDGNESDDDLLARAKKSSTTTTFCVEIKPGNEQPAVVICDPSKSDQVPIPSHPPPPPPPPHHPHHPHHPEPHHHPEPIPDLPPQFEPIPYEPVIYIPQQPQIIPSFYPQPCPQQSQIILIRDPSCPGSNPTIIPNPYHPAGYLHSPKQFLRASQYPMDSAGVWQNRYGVEGEAQRSFSGSGSSGMQSFGYTNPLELIYPKRGQTSQQSPLTISPITSNGAAVIGGHQNSDSGYDRPVLIQCNPTVTPLSQQAYSSASAGVSDNQGYKTKPGIMGAAGGQTQFMQQPGAFGAHGIQMDQGSSSYQRGGLLPMSNANQYNQPGMYPQQQFHNMQNQMSSGYSSHGKSAEEVQGGIKTGEKIPTHELKQVEEGRSQFDNQGNQGSQGIPGKTLINLQDQQKLGPGKLTEGNQSPETRFNPGSFGQSQDSFANNNNNDNKDQGFHRQMAFSQSQPQQQQQPTPKMGQKNSQQPLNGDMSHDQMLMNRMRSSVAQGNLVQPFMVPSSNFAGEKQMPSKV